ncbi:MAG: sulfite oxidase [Gemmatimonadetes bacterium]|nr:sulfite oxidase [Gemmatimonadota bacterium]
MTKTPGMTRRDAVVRGGAAAAGLALMPMDTLSRWMSRIAQEAVVPWLDRPDESMARVNVLDWEALSSWVTPTEKLFRVGHYGTPEIAAEDWRLEIGGLVEGLRSFTLDELRARPRQDVVMTLECAGNRGFSGFIGAVHNARWTGTPLASVLEEVGIAPDGIEVVFFGADQGEEEIRGNTVTQNFARSMSLDDAMDPEILLCYEVNGEPLPTEHGFPLRVIAPGWYGVANVKWLTRIEIRDTRYMGRFMARDYVTLREEVRDGETVWAETSVGRAKINSVPAKVTRDGDGHRIHGAAWGADIARVEVRIDDGAWREATLGEGRGDPDTWTFWHIDWAASDGEHAITSRAISSAGDVQPAADDPLITRKKTYWESNGQLTRRVSID